MSQTNVVKLSSLTEEELLLKKQRDEIMEQAKLMEKERKRIENSYRITIRIPNA